MLLRPALHGAKGDPVLLSDPSQWHTLLEVGPQELETLEGECAGLLRELRQGGRSAILGPPRLPQLIPETRMCETLLEMHSAGRDSLLGHRSR